MNFEINKSVEIIELLENYLDFVRPSPEIRSQLDISYEIEDESVILNEIRPFWNDPNRIITTGYAKATFNQKNNNWSIFWKRSDNKWDAYKPIPTVKELNDFLIIVDEDKNYCFKG
jgi:hypothetical protein